MWPQQAAGSTRIGREAMISAGWLMTEIRRVDGSYMCPLCVMSSQDEVKVMEHIVNCHSDSTLIHRQTSPNTLHPSATRNTRKQKQSSSDTRMYPCPFCSYASNRPYNVKIHLQRCPNKANVSSWCKVSRTDHFLKWVNIVCDKQSFWWEDRPAGARNPKSVIQLKPCVFFLLGTLSILIWLN